MKPNWFIALPVDIPGGIEEMGRGAPETLRWLAPADWHVTIAFLGAVDAEAAGRAWALSRGDRIGRVTVRLGALRPFGPDRAPSAFAFVLRTGRTAVADYIRRRREALCAAAGAPTDARPPRPHVSVARPPGSTTPDAYRTLLEWAAGVEPPSTPVTLDRIALYTWADNRAERRFRIVEERRLE